MQHYHLISTYDQAQYYYSKRKYGKARELFASIVFELENSDTDSMADIELHNSSMEYLRKINNKGPVTVNLKVILVIAIVVSLLIYYVL